MVSGGLSSLIYITTQGPYLLSLCVAHNSQSTGHMIQITCYKFVCVLFPLATPIICYLITMPILSINSLLFINTWALLESFPNSFLPTCVTHTLHTQRLAQIQIPNHRFIPKEHPYHKDTELHNGLGALCAWEVTCLLLSCLHRDWPGFETQLCLLGFEPNPLGCGNGDIDML